MTSQKYNPPTGSPPPAYSNDGTNISSPEPAHTMPQNDPYVASPYQNNANPYGGAPQNYPPENYLPQGRGQGGYYATGPQMYQQTGGPQGGYYAPQGYQQQGGPGYYPQQYGPGPQGGYYDDRRGRSSGFMEAMLASLACCCCLDACLLF